MLRGQLVPEGNGEGGLLGVGKALFLDMATGVYSFCGKLVHFNAFMKHFTKMEECSKKPHHLPFL